MARIARVVMRGAAPDVTHISSPNLMLPASKICVPRDAGNAAGLVFFIFDLLHLDGDVGSQPLIERNLPARPASVSHGAPSC